MVTGEPFFGCTCTPVTVMKTDCTPASDVGASARLTLSVELGSLLPPPQADNNAQDTRVDARTDRKTACFIAGFLTLRSAATCHDGRVATHVSRTKGRNVPV